MLFLLSEKVNKINEIRIPPKCTFTFFSKAKSQIPCILFDGLVYFFFGGGPLSNGLFILIHLLFQFFHTMVHDTYIFCWISLLTSFLFPSLKSTQATWSLTGEVDKPTIWLEMVIKDIIFFILDTSSISRCIVCPALCLVLRELGSLC